jgi:hypothetical protein
VHSSNAKNYWISKARGDDESLNLVNWETVDQAMKESPRQLRGFIAKHSVGMCGMGKFTKLWWKERESDACPRCASFKDAPHVWTCSGEGADEVWAQSIWDLEGGWHKLVLTRIYQMLL